MNASKTKPQRRSVAADLVETTPSAYGAGHWLLASPVLLFLLWFWGDLSAYLSPLPRLADWILAIPLFIFLLVLPLGLLSFWLVTSLPKLFHHAGWDVQPLEPVALSEQYLVRYVYRERFRAKTDWQRLWIRAAQGWVYLEIAIIFAAAVAMAPLFFSATEFGFGR